MGVPLTDEADLLARAITMVQELTDKPICIDSSVVEALEAGLSVYQGRALVNSITAEDERMEQILPLVKKYDAAVIALPNDSDEIPMEVEKRIALTRKIVEVATTEYGIAAADIVIDPLAMPIGADQEVVNTTLETMRRIRDEFGVNMTCGASNVSFGMPARHTLGAAFLPMAMTAGLTSAIMDTRTPQIVEAVKAADLLLGHDEWGGAWIAAHRARLAREAAATAVTDSPDFSLDDVAREGLIERPGARARGRTTGPAGSTSPSPCTRRPRTAPTSPRRSAASGCRPGVTVFDAASWNGIAIDSTCGGHGTCHKCRVRVEGGRRPDHPPRRRTFTAEQLADGWRLGCLVHATRDLAVEVPPLTTRPKAATVGVGRQVILRPAVQKRYVELDEADAGRPAHRPGPAHRRDRRPRADRRPARACAGCPRCCARPTSR